MNKENPPKPHPPIQEVSEQERVAAEIGSIRDQVNVMGANDKEIPVLNELMTKVKNGGIDPQVALTEARRMLEEKQSYH